MPELAGYRTPLRGLWLTGASTHPGGGVFGVPGRNGARTVLGELGPESPFDLICWNAANCLVEGVRRPYWAARPSPRS